MKTLNDLGGAYWNCKTCDVVARKIAQEIKNLNLKSTQMRVDIDQNTEDISKQKDWNQQMEKRVEKLSNENSNNDAVFDEIRERQKRRKNLVIHQIPEPPSSMTRGADRLDHDVKKVIEIFDFLLCPTTKDGIKFIYRPGERSESGRPRPVILCLKDTGARDYILENSRKLAGSSWNHISIIPDLTAQQHKEEEKLRKTAEKRNSEMNSDESQMWEWVLVGMRGERELIKRKKIFHHDGQGRHGRVGGQGVGKEW